jgi:hypothetical protein
MVSHLTCHRHCHLEINRESLIEEQSLHTCTDTQCVSDLNVSNNIVSMRIASLTSHLHTSHDNLWRGHNKSLYVCP